MTGQNDLGQFLGGSEPRALLFSPSLGIWVTQAEGPEHRQTDNVGVTVGKTCHSIGKTPVAGHLSLPQSTCERSQEG